MDALRVGTASMLALTACGSEVVVIQDTNGGGGHVSQAVTATASETVSTGSGAGGAGGASASGGNVDGGSVGGEACALLDGPPPQPLTIQVANLTGLWIFISDTCLLGGPSGIKVDGQSVLDDLYMYSCDDVVAGTCEMYDCWGGNSVELGPGDTFSTTWDGLLLDVSQDIDVPDECVPGDCNQGFIPESCRLEQVASAGTHTLSILYSPFGGPEEVVQVPFTLPSTSVTAAIGP